VPDKVKVVFNGMTIEQPVSSLTGIAIPCLLGTGGRTPGKRMYEAIQGFFAGLEAEKKRVHPLEESFRKLEPPRADLPPSWFLEAAALWRATASLDPGNTFLFSQLEPKGWDWLKPAEGQRCKERLQQLCEGIAHPGTEEEVVLENAESANSAYYGDFQCMLQGQLDLVTSSCVWELKCYSQRDLGEDDRLQLAMYAYLWLCNENEPKQFKLLNVLSGQVLELVLTTVTADGSRAWVPERCEAVRAVARVLLENALLPQKAMGGSGVVSLHAEDRARFLGSGAGVASGGGGGGGSKRPRHG
jgi:hypothetical protein